MLGTQENKVNRKDIAALVVITIASVIGINQYTYGMYNHYITIPFLKSILAPDIYFNDYLLPEKKYFYTYFLKSLATIIKLTGISIERLFFGAYIGSIFLTFLAIFKLSLEFFKRKESAYAALALTVFSFITLGEVRTIESMFLERTFALPFLLFAIYYLFKNRIILAYGLCGFTFLFHPLSATYVIGFITIIALFRFKAIGIKRLAISFGLLLVLVSPALYLKFTTPAPSLSLFNPDPEWIELLRLRSKHHLFPFSWSRLLWAQTLLFLLGFAWIIKKESASEMKKKVLIIAGTIIVFCLAGTIFTELLPTSIVIQFQLFRSFKFLVLIALIFYAHYLIKPAKSKNEYFEKTLLLILLLPVFYTGQMSKFAGIVVVALTLFPLTDIVRAYASSLSRYVIWLQVVLIVAIGISANLLRSDFSIYNLDNSDWVKAQQWAKQNTSKKDLFIVPPQQLGFRVESERTIYGDWKDGTQMFFNPVFGKEWIRRMKLIGYEDDDRLAETFSQLHEVSFIKIKDEQTLHKKVWLVVPESHQALDFPIAYKNEGFVIYEVTS